MSLSLAAITREAARRYNLGDWQTKLLHYTMLPKALRPTMQTFLAEIGVSHQQYYNWLKNPRFNNARREAMRQFFKDDIPDVLMAMKDEAMAGNVMAARLFLEYVDEWIKDPKNEDPDNPDKPLSVIEVKQTINILQQKFYGVKSGETKVIEAQQEPVIETPIA